MEDDGATVATGDNINTCLLSYLFHETQLLDD